MVPKRKFTKPALSSADLVAFLEGKGLKISDKEYAQHCMSYIGYYRLKIYTRPFENSDKTFKPDTQFENIVDIYNFDKKLRLLCLDAIERIEVALRANLINVMGAYGGPHFYYDESYFLNKSAVTRIRTFAESAEHLSIKHYKNIYDDPHLPAIWCLTEASTFGQISLIYADLKTKYRKDIAVNFGFDQSVLISWFKCLSTLRNICAHHGRLWNAGLFVNQPIVARQYQDDLSNNTNLYSRVVILTLLLRKIDPQGIDRWKPRLISLIDTLPSSMSLSSMGFPSDWKNRPLWA